MRFFSIPEVERNKSFEAGQPIVLQCELSDATAQVCWYKDGIELHSKTGIDIQSDGNMRTLIVQSADFIHSGVYTCKTKGDAIKFIVDIKGDLKFAFFLILWKKLTKHFGLFLQLTIIAILCLEPYLWLCLNDSLH